MERYTRVFKKTHKTTKSLEKHIMELSHNFGYYKTDGLTVFYKFEITKKYEIEQDFKKWFKGGNVSKNIDGTFSTQCAQYRNRIKSIEDLKKYFINEFIN